MHEPDLPRDMLVKLADAILHSELATRKSLQAVVVGLGCSDDHVCLYQQLTLIFGFLFSLSQFVSRAPRSSLLIGTFFKAFEGLINHYYLLRS